MINYHAGVIAIDDYKSCKKYAGSIAVSIDIMLCFLHSFDYTIVAIVLCVKGML